MALKLLVDPDTDAILGAQGVGDCGVDKRIDVIATAITGGLTASTLAELELAYAPAFSSAKDPVNMLGHVADNLRRGTSASLQWHELADAVAGGAVLVDVRDAAERTDAGVIPEAVHLPLDSLRERLDEIRPGRSSCTARSGCAATPPRGSWPSTAATCTTSTAACAPGRPASARSELLDGAIDRRLTGPNALAATKVTGGHGPRGGVHHDSQARDHARRSVNWAGRVVR